MPKNKMVIINTKDAGPCDVPAAPTLRRTLILGCALSVLTMLAPEAWSATYYVRGDGSGSDSNGGTGWSDAWASVDKALDSLGPNSAATVHTVYVQASAVGSAYDVAYRRGDVTQHQDVHARFEGGWENVDATPAQTGISRIEDLDGTIDEVGFYFSATGGRHGQGKHFYFDRFQFTKVTDGIHLLNQHNLDSAEIRLRLANTTIEANRDGVHLSYNRSAGNANLTTNNVTIKGGQNSGTGRGVYIIGRPDGTVIDQTSIMSDGGKGLHFDVKCNFGNWGPGFTVTIRDSSFVGSSSDAIYMPDAHYAHYNTTSYVYLDRVRISDNGGMGFYRTQDNGNGMRPFELNATNVLFTGNSGDAIHLKGDVDVGGSRGGSQMRARLYNCTVADNGGDGVFLISDQNTGNSVELRNTILVGLGGDGVDVDDGDSAGMTVAETYNCFFGNTGVNLKVHGSSVALNATDFTADPPFVSQAPEPYKLLNGSPLVDGGDPGPAPAVDLLGIARGAAPSVGCFEEPVDTLEARPDATPTLILIGQSFTLSSAPNGGTAPYTSFLWTGPDIPAGQELVEDPGVITPTVTGNLTYTVTVTDSFGVTDTDSVSITVNPPLTATAGGAPVNPSLGDVWDLTATPTGGFPGYTYAWTGPGFTSTDQNPVGVAPPNIGANVYSVTITDSLGNTANDSVTIYRAAAELLASAVADPAALLVGNSTDLSSSASGGSGTGYVFTWSGPGGFTFAGQNPGAVVPPLGTNDYTVTVTDSYGLTDSASVTVRVVNPVQVAPTASPPIIPQFGQTTLSATVTGGSGVYANYAWTGPKGFAHASTSSPDVTVSPPFLGANTYTLTVTDDLGFSGTASVTVYPVASPLAVDALVASSIGGTPFTGDSGAVEFGGTVVLSAIVTGGTGDFSYAWTGPNGFTSTDLNPGSVVPPNRGQNTYTIAVTDLIAGDSVSDSVTISVVDAISPLSLYLEKGGVSYQGTTPSRAESPLDWFRMKVRGIDLNPGDQLSFSLNGRGVGALIPGGGLTLDSKGRARGQLGDPSGHVFHDCRITYRAKKRRLRVICRKGTYTGSGPVVQATSGVSPVTRTVVFIDRVPADGLIDEVAVLPVSFRVKVRATSSGVVTEKGRMSRRR